MASCVLAAVIMNLTAIATPGELQDCREWLALKLEGQVATAPEGAWLEAIANHGIVHRNARGGRPLRVGEATFSRGLYCHAPSQLRLHLAGPAARFEAIAGVDRNDQTQGGRGSVVFAIRAGDRELWRSEVMREGMAGQAANVDLGGATEVTLEVTDGGDGNSCDQADWAEARVTLADGQILWLGDLPLVEPARASIGSAPFFSFTYGGKPSSELLPQWRVARESRALDGDRTEYTVRYTDPATGLEVRCTAMAYRGFPVVDWMLHFKNTGAADTPILADIQAIDTAFADAGNGFVLHHNKGDNCTPDSYEPLTTALAPNAEQRFAAVGGRPTQIAYPYFNVSATDGGVIFALGWPGQWSAQFVRSDAEGLRIRGGQELTHFVLHPGEEVRAPRVVLLFYTGEWQRAQNVWRRWMCAHNMPHPEGQLIQPMVSLCNGNFYPGLMTNAAQEIAFIQRHLDEGIGIQYWWEDAGWYPCDGVTWPKTGTWEVDPVRFPKGIREVSDYARARGVKTIVWFEPERVHPDTWLTKEHPEWVLGGAGGGLLNLGNPEAWKWLVDHIDRLMTDQGIDVYRQDFNMDPLSFWRGNDTEDRQGITEIRHVEGYLAFWDELLRRHPGLIIDSCASGGRRNDIETLKRAVPLLRSDWYAGEAGQQGHTYGLGFWVPFQGTGVIYQTGDEKSEYWYRSSMVAEFTFGPGAGGIEGMDFSLLRRMVEEWRLVSPSMLGDFYPLTPYSLAEDDWMAWQYDVPEAGHGAVQVFRHRDSVYEAVRFRLKGLDDHARYEVRDTDGATVGQFSGADLMNTGLPITMPKCPQARTMLYHRVP